MIDLEKVTEFTEAAGIALASAASLTTKQAAVAAEVADIAPGIADSLIAALGLPATSKSAAVAALGDHVKAVRLLDEVLDRVKQSAVAKPEAPQVLGRAEKRASAVQGPVKRESDLAWEAGFPGSR